MAQSVKSIIYQAILEEKWIEIEYINSKKENTIFYIGIADVDAQKDKLYVDIFNSYKDNKCLGKYVWINMAGILNARLLEQSYYPSQKKLIDKVNNDPEVATYLEADTLDNNILSYLSDCYRLDNDPYIKNSIMVNGVDIHTLLEQEKYVLDDDQFNSILDMVFKHNKYDAEKIYRNKELAFNIFSIDINGKQYVVAYRGLALNFKNKTLKLSKKTSINKSFLIEEDKSVTLGMYLDANPDDFCEKFDEYQDKWIELIKGNFRNNEKVNTRPTIFILDRKSLRGVDQAFEAISASEEKGTLTQPIKAFFGRNRAGTGTQKDPNIVVFDKNKINIDQMRVVYNSMVNHTTYIKGPPGTGKTETIFNVLLSAYANNKTVLVCSNNNHPVNDIFKKMTSSLTHRKPYTNQVEKIIFPIIRLGNNTETIETLSKLRDILSFALTLKDKKTNEEKTNESKDKVMSGYSELRQILKQYEEKIDLIDTIKNLNKMSKLSTSEAINKKISEQIEVQNKKLESMPNIDDEMVTKYAISASEDRSFQNYVYYSSLERLRKLNYDSFEELRAIITNGDLDSAVTDFNKYLRDDKNLRKFLDVFPIVVTTNLSSEKLGSPKPHFDLCIMDESGQCNVASSLIPIVRATDLLLVGDTNQLQPVTVLEPDVNDSLMTKYGIKKEYNYIKNSILSTMLSKDKNSKSILLSYHYRCGKKIAGFVNDRFYNEQLKLINQNPGNLVYYDVKNRYNPEARNAYEAEAREIANLIKRNDYHDVGIITPFVNQAALINRYLDELGIKDTRAGTIHTLQGSEKSVIIVSAALSLRTGDKTMDWIKNNHELINVAVTRAKESLIFVGDKEAIDTLSKGEINDIKALSDYVKSNGEYKVPRSEISIMADFSNDSQSEKNFFDTINPYFNRRGTKFRIERNMPVREALKNANEEDFHLIGKKEFDVVVQATEGLLNRRYRTVVVFEIDGGEHVGSKETVRRDREKEQICIKYGIKLIRIANSQVKDYELIIKLFESTVEGIKDIESVQMSLFDE